MKNIFKNVIKEKSCGIIVFRNDGNNGKGREYLILHYQSGHFDFPKGHVEAGETETETVLRELTEETGIVKIALKPNFREKISYFYRNGKQKYFKDVFFYLGETKNPPKIRLSHEHIGYKWLPFPEALKTVTHENAKELLRKAEKFLKIS